MPRYTSSEPTSRPDHVYPGDYTVEVINAEAAVSKQGNDLIELKLKVVPQGVILYDNLVFAPNAFWKIDTFRAATGDKIVPGEEVDVEPDDLIGRTGRARLVVEEYNGRKRNKVAAWLVPQTTSDDDTSDDDEIPF